MADRSDATELGWEEQQRADSVQHALERDEWLKDFALAFLLIVLTIAIATLLAAWHLTARQLPLESANPVHPAVGCRADRR